MSKEKYRGRKYMVQEYDPDWVKQYETEAQVLRNVLSGSILSIEHTGSTSVPELAGKPTIDILIVLENINEADGFKDKLKVLDYQYLGQYVMDDSRLFVREQKGVRLVNLHFYPEGHKHISEIINLRGYLRTHPDVVEEYSQLKFDLVKKYPDDYGSYRKYKDEWMNDLMLKLNKK